MLVLCLRTSILPCSAQKGQSTRAGVQFRAIVLTHTDWICVRVHLFAAAHRGLWNGIGDAQPEEPYAAYDVSHPITTTAQSILLSLCHSGTHLLPSEDGLCDCSWMMDVRYACGTELHVFLKIHRITLKVIHRPSGHIAQLVCIIAMCGTRSVCLSLHWRLGSTLSVTCPMCCMCGIVSVRMKL